MLKYIVPIDLDFTTMTSGTVYFSFFNTHHENISIFKVNTQTMSATGSGNTRCMLGMARATGNIPTTGTIVAYTKFDTNFGDIGVDIRKSPTGLSVAGTTIYPYFTEVAIRTGSDGHIIPRDYGEDYGLVLAPGQGIVIVSDGELVSGSSLHGNIIFGIRH